MVTQQKLITFRMPKISPLTSILKKETRMPKISLQLSSKLELKHPGLHWSTNKIFNVCVSTPASQAFYVEARACCLHLCTGGKNLEEDVVRASFIILNHKLCPWIFFVILLCFRHACLHFVICGL
ncbi:unnamed protein product [Cuscuta europaea]|uniref:Uncharacterized protein n=1 Tax=Cuscuta europaea TaxID=41803 RepID=A0A9P0YY45_CUSEU|nr:unnamed protein product [Cuscuta europaea]